MKAGADSKGDKAVYEVRLTGPKNCTVAMSDAKQITLGFTYTAV
ncbi:MULTISPECIES: hypothetical protein [unclassified Streptomyces]|nr:MULTISPECIES: hypothetical protein [unclassified Streptomyces]MCX4990297.1 hypothetical protein [Streptomyces sp. NBC_00568]MCX5004472.1 hypothetical protein [Streptomyces sp. NBC_00638]